MSLCFSASFGGTNDSDNATISYTGRPTAMTVGCWIKGGADNIESSIINQTTGGGVRFSWKGGTAGIRYPQLVRAYSVTNLSANADGRTLNTTTWYFILAAHSGTATDAVVFREPAGSNVAPAAAQTNGSGTLTTTTGTLKIGLANAGLPLRAKVAELFICDYVLSTSDINALEAGGSPMALAVQPVWYNRMRTDGTGTDAQVGSITAVSGALYNTSDNPTVNSPPGGFIGRHLMLGVG